MKTTILALIIACLCIPMWSQTCSISPSQPQPALPGQCVQFTANGCTGANWTLTGAGILDQTGRYCAPSQVPVPNSTRGHQVTPIDNIVNLPVLNLPVHPSSPQWLARAAQDHASVGSYHNLKPGTGPYQALGFWVNPADANTPTQPMFAHYPWPASLQGVQWPIVQEPDVLMQNGRYEDTYGAPQYGTGPDRHMFTIGPDGTVMEQYGVLWGNANLVLTPGNPTRAEFDSDTAWTFPTPLTVVIKGATGGCTGINFNGTGATAWQATVLSQVPGTNGHREHVVITIPYNTTNCAGLETAQLYSWGNGQDPSWDVSSMTQWPNYDNSIYGGTDAAGTSIVATSGDQEAGYHNVVDGVIDPACNCVTYVHHALRTTVSNSYLSARDFAGTVTGSGITYGHPLVVIDHGCTNGNPTVCTVSYNLANLSPCENPPWQWAPGCQGHVFFTGFTGPWAALNDNSAHTNTYLATYVSQTQISIPVDSTRWGSQNWAAQNNRFAPDWMPYGTRLRLKASYNIEGFCSDSNDWCKFAKAFLRTIRVYGIAPDDGTVPGSNWQTALLSNGFEPDVLINAWINVNKFYNFDQQLEAAQTDGTQPFAPYTNLTVPNNQLGTTNYNRVTVTVSGSNGSASQDVNLQGVVIGIVPEIIPTLYPGTTYKPKVVVSGTDNTDFTCTLAQGANGVGVSPDGTINAASNLSAKVGYQLKCWADADSRQIAYADGYAVPTDSHGAWHLCFGCLKQTYTDTHNVVWQGQMVNRQVSSVSGTYEQANGCKYAPIYGSFNFFPSYWGSYPDAGLYGASLSSRNDIACSYIVPNGNYEVDVLGESGMGVSAPGNNVFIVQINGQNMETVDGYLAAGGQYRGYTKQYQANVTDGRLNVSFRQVYDLTTSPYGISVSAVRITPSGSQPLQFNPPSQLTGATLGHPYSYQFMASGGVTPYTFTLTQGSLPTGMQLTAQGLLAGTPTLAGLYSFTVQVCDSSTPQPQCLSGTSSMGINAPAPPLQILTTSLPNGMKGIAYDVFLQGSGGVPPYRWGSSSAMPPGLQLTTAGEINGTPTQPGAYLLNVTLSDSQGTPAATAKLTLTIAQPAPPVITTTSLPDGTVGKAYPVTQLQASGGQLPYRWTLASGALPPGLLLSGTGTISGTPKASGTQPTKTYAFTVKVTDANSQTATANLSITVRIASGSGPGGVASAKK